MFFYEIGGRRAGASTHGSAALQVIDKKAFDVTVLRRARAGPPPLTGTQCGLFFALRLPLRFGLPRRSSLVTGRA